MGEFEEMHAKYYLLVAACFCCTVSSNCQTGDLRVGTAKIDITPTPEESKGLRNVWGTAFTGIHDHVYVRAIVIDNGKTSAALVTEDTSQTPDTLAVRQRIEKEIGVPASNIFISATHTHNAPIPNTTGRQLGPGSAKFSETVNEAYVEAVREAKAKLQPGKMVLAQGHADLNVNRDEFVGDRWKTGRNPTRPSDKTVWILRFETAAGEPVAYFVNYGVHALTLGPDNTLVTGDFPGATSRFIESYYNDKVVALWTSGPAGDQNLIATSWDLDDNLTHKVREPGEAAFQLADSMARILGEISIEAADKSKDVTANATIWSDSRDTVCPGQQFDRDAYAKGLVEFKDAPPQTVHLDLLMINNIALAGVAAEVVTNIYYHLKKDSPLTNTILVSLTNGRLTYMPDDAAYDTPIFEVRSSSLKRGCGEGAIVTGFTEMIKQRLGMDAPMTATSK
jgi:neutral ceramidase